MSSTKLSVFKEKPKMFCHYEVSLAGFKRSNLFLLAGMLVTLYIAYKTIINLKDLGSLWILMPGYVIGVLLLLIFIVGDIRLKERREYASVMRKILVHSRKERSNNSNEKKI